MADIVVPIHQQFVQLDLIFNQFRKIGRARQQVKNADIVHQASKHGLIGIDATHLARQYTAHCRYMNGMFPKPFRDPLEGGHFL